MQGTQMHGTAAIHPLASLEEFIGPRISSLVNRTCSAHVYLLCQCFNCWSYHWLGCQPWEISQLPPHCISYYQRWVDARHTIVFWDVKLVTHKSVAPITLLNLLAKMSFICNFVRFSFTFDTVTTRAQQCTICNFCHWMERAGIEGLIWALNFRAQNHQNPQYL